MLARIPLEAFRVFDAAARRLNFSAAARELGITQAAVSRRIRGLEDRLGAALFERRGRRVALTAEGARLHARVRAALDYLAEAVAPFAPRGGPAPVTMAASGSVSHLWLGPVLRRFARAHPELSVRLLTSDAMADLADERHDLTILYSMGAHPRWHLTPLIAEELVPVAAPAYLAERGLAPGPLPAGQIARLDLIDYARFDPHWVDLAAWFAAQGVSAPPARLGFTAYLPAVEAALAGDGVALGSRGLLAGHLAAGRLVALSQAALATGYGYWLGLPRGREPRAETLALHAALAAAAA